MESTLEFSRATAPPLRPVLAGSLFAVAVCVMTGPFETLSLPLPSRLVFWLVLIGWNSLKWWLWYGWLGPRTTTRRTAALAAVAGALLLNATLPLEIDLMFRAIGRPFDLPWFGLYLMALLIAGSISALLAVIRAPRSAAAPAAATLAGPAAPAPAAPAPAAPAIAAAPVAVPPLLAQRAGLPDLADVLMVVAEDHYLRLMLSGGPGDYRRPLILFRLSDALPELTGQDGLQVHRSAWVARRHVVGALRDGRRWKLRLGDGSEQAISETFLATVRAAGWLQTKL